MKQKKIVNAQKIEKYKQLFFLVLSKNKEKIHTNEALDLTTTLLMMNPELYTVWNYRRRILLSLFVEPLSTTSSNESNEENPKRFDWIEREMKLMEGVIAAHPKSYWCWFQRKWAFLHLPSLELRTARAREDLLLCNKVLDVDSRNFHCWNFRRFVMKHGGATKEDELAFTTTKIEQSFSNYSAWHQRSCLFPLVHPPDSSSSRHALDSEYELVTQAFFTDPADQSAWFYHRWLRSMSSGSAEIMKRELAMCESLLELEPNSKWAILTKLFILKEMGESEREKDLVKGLLSKLESIDPMHAAFYRDFHSLKDI